MAAKDKAYKLYTEEHSVHRLKAIQNLCRSENISGILAIAGIDGRDNLGSTRLINYLLCGLSGHELVENMLYKYSMEDTFLLIQPDAVYVYTNPTNHKYFAEKTAGWPNLTMLRIDGLLYVTDKESAEIFKVETFIKMVQTCSSKIGFPFTPTVDKPDGNKMEIEQMPLVQAYAFEDFKTGQFFTQAFNVQSVFHQLNELYCRVDPQALVSISNNQCHMLWNQWNNCLRNIDLRLDAVSDLYDLAELKRTSEELLIEPLTTYYRYALIRSETKVESLSYPALSFSGQDVYRSTERTMEISDNPKYFTIVASDPLAPICAARSYFLSLGKVPEDECLDGIEDSSVLQKYDNKETVALMELYAIIVKCFEELIKSLSDTDIATRFQELVCDTVLGANKSDKLEHMAKEAVVNTKIVNLNLSPYLLSQAPVVESSSLKYVQIEVGNLSLESGTGSIVYGNTIASTRSATINITESFTNYECWFAQDIEFSRTKAISTNVVNRLTKSHDLMGRWLQDATNVTLMFGHELIPYKTGKLRYFSHGLCFLHARMGAFVYPFENTISHITTFADDNENLKYVQLEYEALNPPYQLLSVMGSGDNNSIVLVLHPGTLTSNRFIHEILPEWKESCDKLGIIFNENRLSVTPLPDAFKNAATEIELLEDKDSRSTNYNRGRLSLYVPSETVQVVNKFQVSPEWKSVLQDLIEL